MRFGICAPPERAAELAAVGYDFVEWPLSRTVGVMDDEAYGELRRLAAGLPVRPEAWNVMLPGHIKVVGPELDHDALQEYLEAALPRVAELGGEVVVFGSGGARRVPEGYGLDDGLCQFEEACRIAGEIAQGHGLTIAVEPLNRNETNLVNTVAEAVTLVSVVAHPAVRLLSDLYHLTIEAEPLSDTETAEDLLAHVHIAAPDRSIPLPGRGEQELRDYFTTLREAGYDGRISVEASWDGVEEAAAGLRFMREVWGDA